MPKIQLHENNFLTLNPCPENSDQYNFYSQLIKKHISQSKIYCAFDNSDALFKIDNDAPHVVIVDEELGKTSAMDFAESLVKNSQYPNFGIIMMANIPDKEHLVDEIVLGRVQFLIDRSDEAKFNQCIAKALNYVSQALDSQYHLKFITQNEILFSEGDLADRAYIVRKGELLALKNIEGSKILLGKIKEGEFVGEMAHLNGEPRSATVQALVDCELIEIPFGTLDLVLFSKPAWSKALVMTLSRRLKATNQVLTENR